MEKIMKCPLCDNTRFERVETARVDLVEIKKITDDAGNVDIVDNVLESKDTEYSYKCANCKGIITEEELTKE